MRPWELHMAPPVRIEIKYGRKNGNRPMRLEHFLVVDRIKDSDNNWRPIPEVHAALDDERPTEVPITLMSDNIQENFAMFRSFFLKGTLMCGSQYGQSTALRRARDGKMVEPYEVDCSSSCPYWQSEDKQAQCDISATLYFKLYKSLPRSNEFGVCRMKGTYAQRYMVGSLNIIHNMTNGILANLPLKLCMNTETRKAQDGKSYKIPLITVQPACSQEAFMEALKVEVERRALLYELQHGSKHSSFDDLKIRNVLTEINKRESFHEENHEVEESEPIILDTTNPFEVLMDEHKLTRAQREHCRLKFSTIEELKTYIAEQEAAIDF